MDSEGSLPCLQEFDTSPSPEPDESSPLLSILFFKIHLYFLGRLKETIQVRSPM
jgi:hypothetical protein